MKTTSKTEIIRAYNKYNDLISEEHYLDGKRHNHDGPAVQRWDSHDGKLMLQEFWRNDLRHNHNGPAVIRWNNIGNRLQEIYWLNGYLHRNGGPAIVFYNGAGTGVPIRHEYWQKRCPDGVYKSVRHREGGPALLSWSDDGGILTEISFWHDGVLHNTLGPAWISWSETTGRLQNEEYRLNGEILTHDEWREALERRNGTDCKDTKEEVVGKVYVVGGRKFKLVEIKE